jgi:4-hydroxybenzoyl-CoA reductase subunit beta
MLRMDPFSVEMPETVDAAVALLQQHGEKAKIVAGGTDAIPNIKHGLHEPDVVVHIGRIKGLKGVRERDDRLEIGALTTLHDVAHDPLVLRFAPGLRRAASLVAGPQLRRMGTLGGNIALDTRCLFYNQTYFWRESLGFCLKKDGSVCHVIAGGKKCVAAASNDTATMLLCLDASLGIAGPSGTRTLPLVDFFVADGVKNHVLELQELITTIIVPKASSSTTRLEGYAKLRHRNAIDYPLLSVGLRVDVDVAGVIVAIRCVVSALQAKPHKLPLDGLVGRPFDAAALAEMKKLGFAKCVPVKNIADDPVWRREMVPVMIERAVADAGGLRA